MALGNDGVSHAGALAAGKPTVAVIGSGIDVCYPTSHLKLAREIVKDGCVLTEFAPGTPPDKFNFPKRNRIISGLCSATLVIEGKERSGALITARAAMDQGRTVYALPGNVGSDNSQLTSLLLKNGAKILTSAEDLLKDFSDKYSGIINLFDLRCKPAVDMMSTLTHLGVGATCPSDDIFKPTIRRSGNSRFENTASDKSTLAENGENNSAKADPEPSSFDAKSIAVYKRIPVGDEIDIESLVNDELDLRELMKCLLKLEMSSFIEVLPGERVRRKSK
jgi:predicted Rossmann fold nucleotide-binding protein DprA/Smf involved in DNA uptake